MNPAPKITSSTELDGLLVDVRMECTRLYQMRPRLDAARVQLELLGRLERAVRELREERDIEIRRYVEGLDAWRRNNAWHAMQIERLQGDLARSMRSHQPEGQS